MRISDWSSDVCSSDLSYRLHSFLLPQGLFVCFGRPFEILFLMRGGRVSPIRDRQDCALIWHSPYISQKKFWRKLMTPSTINQNELDELMDKAVRRSEEHTSELQSLMRISYTVFCLKKKITSQI